MLSDNPYCIIVALKVTNQIMAYTKEQIDEITERETKALNYLKELELTPSAQVIKVNIGNDTFADRVIPYLQDLKYREKPPVVEAEKVEEHILDTTPDAS